MKFGHPIAYEPANIMTPIIANIDETTIAKSKYRTCTFFQCTS